MRVLAEISFLNIKYRNGASRYNRFYELTLQCSKKSYFYRRQYDTRNKIDKDDIPLMVLRFYSGSH